MIASAGQGDSFRENRPPGPPAKAFHYWHKNEHKVLVICVEVFNLQNKGLDRMLHSPHCCNHM